MGDREAKDALFAAFARVAHALASNRRAEIVDTLAQGERSVDEVAGAIDQSVANTSHHLQVLAAAGLVRRRRDGTRIIYALASDGVEELWAAVRTVAVDHLADTERLARDYLGPEVEPVTRRELERRLLAGEVEVIDVRPVLEYRAGHLPGARSAPVDELEQHLGSLSRDREIVAYCRGPYCVYADEATRLLRDRGFHARRLEDGFPEWRRAGLPVERGDAS